MGGGAAESVDFADSMADRLPLVVGFVLRLTMLMMVFAFRSVPLALVTTALNLASVAVAFGVLALVFEHAWAESLLDFTVPATSSTGSRCSCSWSWSGSRWTTTSSC